MAQHYQGLYYTIIDGVMDYDYATNTCRVNPYLQEHFGFSGVVENAREVFLEGIHPNDLERVQRITRYYCTRPGEPWRIVYRYLWRDDTYHEVLNRQQGSLRQLFFYSPPDV